MRLLLDSHAFLWFVLKNPQLSRAADTLITDPANDILVSPATYWEIAIKVGKKKLDLMASYDDFMKRGIEGNDFEILPIETRHTSLLTTMPMHHKDPFDRLIISQALAEQIPVVGVDTAFDPYGVTRLW
jgi:PIN domain nuclease of toxin-antitoxin system